MEREARNRVLLTAALAVVLIGGTTALILTAGTCKVKMEESHEKVCNEGWECSGSKYCCNDTITDFFKVYQFENLFSERNSPVAHAVGFWDYQSFITAAALFEPLGFCTTGGKQMQMMELCAFLGHVGARTSCGYGVAAGGRTAWGLCYRRQVGPDPMTYCDKTNTQYPCVEGVEYYGRGAIPIYWNYNYGATADGIHKDLLYHPEYLEQNATMAFMAAMWRWMTPMKKQQPSAHDVFVGNWKPTKNDTLNKRLPGFGTTMNVLYGGQICGKGYDDSMNNIISHYQCWEPRNKNVQINTHTHNTLIKHDNTCTSRMDRLHHPFFPG